MYTIRTSNVNIIVEKYNNIGSAIDIQCTKWTIHDTNKKQK